MSTNDRPLWKVQRLTFYHLDHAMLTSGNENITNVDQSMPTCENKYKEQIYLEVRRVPVIRYVPVDMRECVVCLQNKTFDQYERMFSPDCQHIQRTICDECVYNYTKFTLANVHSTDVVCPELNCNDKFHYEGIREILRIGNDQTLFEQYDHRVNIEYLKQMPNFILCAHPGCNSGLFCESDRSKNRRITCTECHRDTCSFHGIIWHVGFTCNQYDREHQTHALSKKWIRKYTRPCPRCHRNIEKIGGCDHMTCRICRYQFCWKCSADYREIFIRGPNKHRIICRHFRPRIFAIIRSVIRRI